MPLTITVASHPLLEVGAFVTRFATRLADTTASEPIVALLGAAATAPFQPDEKSRTMVRDLLRSGGFKPAGRSKPASEYLVAARAEDRFPRINAAVDACNVVSLHSGLPISLVDLDRLDGTALRVDCAPPGTTYVFNPSGQVIDASGLLCLVDAGGPTGTPVKDAQRTKTHDDTRAAISLVWGSRAMAGHTAAVTAWYRELVATIAGATIEDVAVRAA